MVATTAEDAAACVVEVERFFHAIAARLGDLAAAIAPAFDTVPATSERVLAIARPPSLALLSEPMVIGAGFVATRDAVADAAHLLAWWQGDDRERIPDSTVLSDSTDYSRQEWFRVPARTGDFHVTGPYIDYVCTDEYVVTSTLPVHRDGRLLGVVGLDILAETLESVLMPTFRRTGATLINHHSRVMLSGDARIFAGEVVDRDRFSQAMTCTGLPATVLV